MKIDFVHPKTRKLNTVVVRDITAALEYKRLLKMAGYAVVIKTGL